MMRVRKRAKELLPDMKGSDNLAKWLAARQGEDGLWDAGEGAAAKEEDNRVAASALALYALGGVLHTTIERGVTALAKLRKQDGRLCQSQTANALAALALSGPAGGRRPGDIIWSRAKHTFVGLVRFAYASQKRGGGWPSMVGEEGEDFLSTVCWLEAARRFPGPAFDETELDRPTVGDLGEWSPDREVWGRFTSRLDRWGKRVLEDAATDKALLPMIVMYTKDSDEGGVLYRQMASEFVKEGILPAPAGSLALAMMTEKVERGADVEHYNDLMEFYALLHPLLASMVEPDGSWPDDPQIGTERRLWGRTGQTALALVTLDSCRGFVAYCGRPYWLFYEKPGKMKPKEKAATNRTEQKNSAGWVVPTAPRK